MAKMELAVFEPNESTMCQIPIWVENFTTWNERLKIVPPRTEFDSRW